LKAVEELPWVPFFSGDVLFFSNMDAHPRGAHPPYMETIAEGNAHAIEAERTVDDSMVNFSALT